jgi:hypothetical protein
VSSILNRCKYDLMFPCPVTIVVKLLVMFIFIFSLSVTIGKYEDGFVSTCSRRVYLLFNDSPCSRNYLMLKIGNNDEGSNVDMWPLILMGYERKIHKICQDSHFLDTDSNHEV